MIPTPRIAMPVVFNHPGSADGLHPRKQSPALIADKHVIGEDVIQGNVVGTTVVARPDLYLAKNMPLVR